jgi:putative chitinase
MLTLAQLQAAMPFAGDRAAIFLGPLNEAIEEFQIDTLVDRASFLAQVAHESGSLRYTREGHDGSDYEGRADLGNTEPGDGKRFPGRGLMQITGRTNTLRCLRALGRPDTDTAYLETPIGAARSAGWYWRDRGLSEIAKVGNFGTLTKKINGGYNGLDDRIRHYITSRRAIGI